MIQQKEIAQFIAVRRAEDYESIDRTLSRTALSINDSEKRHGGQIIAGMGSDLQLNSTSFFSVAIQRVVDAEDLA
jgi:hypothetical protein